MKEVDILYKKMRHLFVEYLKNRIALDESMINIAA